MSGADRIWFLAAAAGIIAVGLIGLWLIRRRPRSMQTHMDAFSRELDALAPRRRSSTQTTSTTADQPAVDLTGRPVSGLPARRSTVTRRDHSTGSS